MFKKLLLKLKKEKDIKPTTAIEAIRQLSLLLDDSGMSEQLKIQNIKYYLNEHKIKPYDGREFEYYQKEIEVFFRKLFPLILLDKSCNLWRLILGNITNGRDDDFSLAVFKNKNNRTVLIEEHCNIKLFLDLFPTKSIFYYAICSPIKEIKPNKKFDKNIDILIHLRTKNFFRDEHIKKYYLNYGKKEKSVEEFKDNITNYPSLKKKIESINNF